MRIVIIPSEGRVVVDSVSHDVDLSGLDQSVHAIEWSGTRGIIEYKNDGEEFRGNEVFEDFTPYQAALDAWQAIEDTPPPPPPPPAPVTWITRRQLILVLLQAEFITGEEAVAAATSGAIPTFIETAIAAMSESDQVVARVTWAAMSGCDRSDPLLALLASATGTTEEQLDEFFALAATL